MFSFCHSRPSSTWMLSIRGDDRADARPALPRGQHRRGDLGASAAKKYDIEVLAAREGRDPASSRAAPTARTALPADGGSPRVVHTLNDRRDVLALGHCRARDAPAGGCSVAVPEVCSARAHPRGSPRAAAEPARRARAAPGATGAGPAEGPLRLVELPDPRRGRESQLVLGVGACAVCRTDLQLAEGDLPLPGHQAVGVVTAVGADVAGWRTGERAAVTWLASACGTCPRCREGREEPARAGPLHGLGRRRRVRGAARGARRLRAAAAGRLHDVAAAPLLCGGAIGYRSLRVAGVQPESLNAARPLRARRASRPCTVPHAPQPGWESPSATRSANGPRGGARARRGVGRDDPHPRPWPLDTAITFAPVGRRRRRGAASAPAGHGGHQRHPPRPRAAARLRRPVVGARIRSVANVTRRDAQELLALASSIGLRTEHEVHELAAGNEALRRLASGEVAARWSSSRRGRVYPDGVAPLTANRRMQFRELDRRTASGEVIALDGDEEQRCGHLVIERDGESCTLAPCRGERIADALRHPYLYAAPRAQLRPTTTGGGRIVPRRPAHRSVASACCVLPLPAVVGPQRDPAT